MWLQLKRQTKLKQKNHLNKWFLCIFLYLRYACVSIYLCNHETYSIALHVVKFYKCYSSWIEYLCVPHLPPQIYVEALTPNVIVTGGGALGKAFIFRWDHEGRVAIMELEYLKEDWEAAEFSLNSHAKKRSCIQQVGSQLQARNGTFIKNSIGSTLILVFLASRTVRSKCCLSLPLYGITYSQPELSETLRSEVLL